MKKLQKNCITVLNRLVKMCEEDDEFAQSLASDLDTMLNDIHSQDGFGTEGQSDPRGDFRNGRWSMKKVESDSRMEREEKFLTQWKLQDDALKAILALVQRKIAAGDTTVTAEELLSCMPPHPTV